MEHVERNWFSDLTLLQIESIPAGYNEVMAVCKHSARNNNPSVSPQLTDDTKSKPSHCTTTARNFQVESMFCDQFPEREVYAKYTRSIISESQLLVVKCCNWMAVSQKANEASPAQHLKCWRKVHGEWHRARRSVPGSPGGSLVGFAVVLVQ